MSKKQQIEKQEQGERIYQKTINGLPPLKGDKYLKTDKWDGEGPNYYYRDKILTLIASEVKQARIDELEKVLTDGGLKYHLKLKDGTDVHSYVERRLQQLKEEDRDNGHK